MSHLEQRIVDKNLKLLSKEVIDGAHAGNIFRIDVLDGKNFRCKYIYKEFATERNNEVDIYAKLGNHIKPFSKLVQVWDHHPQAILMCDLEAPLKDIFNQLSIKNKWNLITEIIQSLSALHSSKLDLQATKLPTHQITSEWHT